MSEHDPSAPDRLLVVDDQPDIRELLLTALRITGFDVTLADGGPAALGLLDRNERFDLILLDVQMPEMDGWDTLTQVRRRFGPLGPRVVMCTVKGHPRDMIRGWTIGCDGYIWKPFDLKLLAAEITRVRDRPEAERAKVRRAAIGEAQILLRTFS